MPELLQLVEAALDEIALFVAFLAVGDAIIAVASRRNVRRAVLVLDQLPDPVGILAFIGQHMRTFG